MLAALRVIYGVIAALSVMYLAIGLLSAVVSEVARFWFIGSGLTIMFVALLGFSGLQRLRSESVVSNTWRVGNFAGAVFVGYACLILPELQNFLLFALMFTSGCIAVVVTELELRSNCAARCCVAHGKLSMR